MSDRTVRRRLEEPEFRRRVEAMRAELVSRAAGKLAGIGALAGRELKKLLTSKNETVRQGAIRSALQFMFHGHEADRLGRQVKELQELLEELLPRPESCSLMR
jgi:hypothetical protein